MAVERQIVSLAGQSMTITPLEAVRGKCGYWTVRAEVEFDVVVGPGRRVKGKQVVRMTRGSLTVEPDKLHLKRKGLS